MGYEARATERAANVAQIEQESAQELASKQDYVVSFKDGVAEVKAINMANQQQLVSFWNERRKTEKAVNVSQIEAESAEELAGKQENRAAFKESVAAIKEQNAALAQQQVAFWNERRKTEKAANVSQIEQESAFELAKKQSDIQGHKEATALIKSENEANQVLQTQFWQERRKTEKAANVRQIEQESTEELLNRQERVDLHRSQIESSKSEINMARQQWLSEVKDMHGAYKEELEFKREMGVIEDAERIEAARWTSLPDSYLQAFNSMDA